MKPVFQLCRKLQACGHDSGHAFPTQHTLFCLEHNPSINFKVRQLRAQCPQLQGTTPPTKWVPWSIRVAAHSAARSGGRSSCTRHRFQRCVTVETISVRVFGRIWIAEKIRNHIWLRVSYPALLKTWCFPHSIPSFSPCGTEDDSCFLQASLGTIQEAILQHVLSRDPSWHQGSSNAVGHFEDRSWRRGSSRLGGLEEGLSPPARHGPQSGSVCRPLRHQSACAIRLLGVIVETLEYYLLRAQ